MLGQLPFCVGQNMQILELRNTGYLTGYFSRIILIYRFEKQNVFKKGEVDSKQNQNMTSDCILFE